MDVHKFKTGDPVIYRLSKFSTHPGPRARTVHPSRHGDDYAYHVDKFWVVETARPDGSLVLRTRQGKQRVVLANDRNLHRARWWERLRYHWRFPTLDGYSQTA